jgi:hypothetical protein
VVIVELQLGQIDSTKDSMELLWSILDDMMPSLNKLMSSSKEGKPVVKVSNNDYKPQFGEQNYDAILMKVYLIGYGPGLYQKIPLRSNAKQSQVDAASKQGVEEGFAGVILRVEAHQNNSMHPCCCSKQSKAQSNTPQVSLADKIKVEKKAKCVE